MYKGRIDIFIKVLNDYIYSKGVCFSFFCLYIYICIYIYIYI